MKKKTIATVLTVLGAALLAGGLVLAKVVADPRGVMVTLPYLMVGVGCGVFGHGLGDLLAKGAVKGNSEAEKRLAIEQNDERNVAITHRAKARAYDVMLVVFGVLMVSFALMDVALPVVLLLVAAYLVPVVVFALSFNRYQKEM